MILKHLVVGMYITNTYIFGSSETKEVVFIDPGSEPERIIKTIEELDVKPIAVLLTHGHYDHTLKVGKLLRHFNIPLMFHKNEFDSGIYSQKKADRWLKEGDSVNIGEITLNVLETPGHSPGSLTFFSKDPKEYNGQKIDGVIFPGDLIFRRSIGRSDLRGGDSTLLFSCIKYKIMNNPEITDNFLEELTHCYRLCITELEKEWNENDPIENLNLHKTPPWVFLFKKVGTHSFVKSDEKFTLLSLFQFFTEHAFVYYPTVIVYNVQRIHAHEGCPKGQAADR